MKKVVFFDSYKTVFQNDSGGVQMRIRKMEKFMLLSGKAEVKLFDQWHDKLDECDVLHIFKINIDSYNLMVLAKRMNKRIVVSSVVPLEKKFRTKVALAIGNIFKVLNTYSIYKKCLLLADYIVAQTTKEKDFIAKYYGINESKITVIPNGVDERFLSCRFNPEEKQNVLCVGRFDENKNQLSLIKAMKGTGIPVCFVGGADKNNPSYYDECVNEARGYDNFVFYNWVNHDSNEFIDIFQKAKTVVLISKKEIFGNSIIEGAASGANLVCTNALNLQEWGFDAKYIRYVNPADTSEIRKAVTDMFFLENSGSLSERAKKVFSWENIAKKYMELYFGNHD